MPTGREVVDTIKEAFELFSEMELPLKEREVTIMHEAALPLIGYIEHLEAAQPKWISVEERLPEECTEVLVYFDGVIAKSEIIMFDMITKYPIWSYTGAGGDPTHWMPLPSTEGIE